MAGIVNLRQARKDRARAAKDARAADNRTQFGRTKAEKGGAEAERTARKDRVGKTTYRVSTGCSSPPRTSALAT